MIAEKFTIQTIANGFLLEGSCWRGTHHFATKEEATSALWLWMEQSMDNEKYRLESLNVRTE